MLKSPIQQHVISNCAGLYQLLNQERPRISLERFGRQAMAAAEKAGLAALDEAAAVDAFWSGVATAKPPLYAADIDDSLFPPANELDAWNLRALPDLLRTVATNVGADPPIDLRAPWYERCPRTAGTCRLMQRDGLHPNNAGTELIARTFARALRHRESKRAS